MGGAERQNIDVVKTIIKFLGKGENLITFVEDRKGHDWRYAIDYSKAEKEFGWRPLVNFEEGLLKTVEWYQNNQEWVESVSSKL